MIRLPEKDERFKGAQIGEAIPYLELVRSQILDWLQRGEVPYQQGPLTPLSDAWWDQVRRLLQFRVRIDEPKPIECVRPEAEIELLYEAVAKPKKRTKQRRTRLETALRGALDRDVFVALSGSRTVPGYHHKPVEVMRVAEKEDHRLVVEVINLAEECAVKEADALTSRLLRIKAGPAGSFTSFVVGYLASPNGLNGEGYMVDWIHEKSGSPVYDLIRNSEEFKRSVAAQLADLGAMTPAERNLFAR
jgi:hypothetical protein